MVRALSSLLPEPLVGRHAADLEGDFVLFIIGLRLNQPWQLRRFAQVNWWTYTTVKQARARADLGLMHVNHGYLKGVGPFVLQFWRSWEQLEAYSHDKELLHVPSWAKYNREVRPGASVGVWHETYLVSDGAAEGVYVNMPQMMMGLAGGVRPVGSHNTSAASRMKIPGRPTQGQDVPAPVAPQPDGAPVGD